MSNEVETGIERDSDVTNSEADIFAYADDGEYATVWEIDRLSNSIIRVNYYRCEAGLSEHDGEDKFEIDPEKTTEEWAKEYAKAHKSSVEVARDYWN